MKKYRLKSCFKGLVLYAVLNSIFCLGSVSAGLKIENEGTPQAHFTYHEKPLFSFGSMSDFIFYAAEDAFDYKLWADWQAAHGMNHCRAYLPGSWVYVEKFAAENGGSADNVLFPFQETEPGSRQFDLTRFDQRYWRRFREQCEYLQSKGIILDLLMINGWQMFNYNAEVAVCNWDGHFFNPKNNVNPCTNFLDTESDSDNRLEFYDSAADQNVELFEIQKRYYEKIIEETHDLDNVYYELVHELGMSYGDWDKVSQWIEVMAHVVRAKWKEFNPNRSIILSTDSGHLAGYPFNGSGGFPLAGSEMEWIWSRPYFDLIIDGNAHHSGNFREWFLEYHKPVIAQESTDDTGQRWTYRKPENRTHLRKYVWKMMMAKCQQIDIYSKSIHTLPLIQNQPGYPHNYDPNGWSDFEKDALLLRQFFESIIDYAALGFDSYFFLTDAAHNLVLSSPKEVIAYISSPTGVEGIEYAPRGAKIWLYDIPFPDGKYEARLFDPKSGPLDSMTVTIKDGKTFFRTTDFIDDYAVQIIR